METTVKTYLESLPAERRSAMTKVRSALKKVMPKGYVEGLQFGMISWFVPLEPPVLYVSLASQKNYMSVYLMGVYADPKQLAKFTGAYAKSGKKLDMGKSCVRFKKLDDLALDVVCAAVASVGVDTFLAQASKRA